MTYLAISRCKKTRHSISRFEENSENADGQLELLACINSLPASGEFCPLLITVTNTLDPDKAKQNVGPNLDPCCLATKMHS